MIPVIQVPNDLEGSVGALCKDWLRQRVPERKPTIKLCTQKIEDKVAEVLKEHSYKAEDLDIDFVNLQNVKVRLPYVIKISIIGMNFDFEKMLDINQTSFTF